MLKAIIAAWRGDTFMNGVVEKFAEMLGDAEYVFHHAWSSFLGQMVIEEIRQPLYDKDIGINANEREIRRMLAEHLSINPKQDVSGCLAMMSMIKDAERIGDNSKNIFELAMLLEGDAKEMRFLERLSVVADNIEKSLPMLKRAYLESDENIAKEIMDGYPRIKQECEEILNALFSEELSGREAAVTAVAVRSLKRINSHVANIASGIVYPLDKIDFVRARGGLLD